MGDGVRIGNLLGTVESDAAWFEAKMQMDLFQPNENSTAVTTDANNRVEVRVPVRQTALILYVMSCTSR